MAPLAGDDFCHHLALRHGAVCQHGFAGQVANGPDVAHGGAALVVDLHGAAVHVEQQALQAPALCTRRATNRHQHLIGGQLGFFALRALHAHGIARRVKPLYLAAQMQLQPEPAQ